MPRDDSVNNFWNQSNTYQQRQAVTRNKRHSTNYNNRVSSYDNGMSYTNTSYKSSARNARYNNNAQPYNDTSSMSNYYNEANMQNKQSYTSNTEKNSQSLYDQRARNSRNAYNNAALNNTNMRRNRNNYTQQQQQPRQNRQKSNVIPMPIDKFPQAQPYNDSAFDSTYDPTIASTSAYDEKEQKSEQSLTLSDWIGILLLTAIPIVNIFFLIRWTLDGSKPQRQTFAKAFLFSGLVLLTFSLVMLNLFYEQFQPLEKFKAMKHILGNMTSNIRKLF